MFGERKGIARPAAIIKGNRVGMSRQQQTACAFAAFGQHVEFMTCAWHRLHFHAEAEIAEPAGQQGD